MKTPFRTQGPNGRYLAPRGFNAWDSRASRSGHACSGFGGALLWTDETGPQNVEALGSIRYH